MDCQQTVSIVYINKSVGKKSAVDCVFYDAIRPPCRVGQMSTLARSRKIESENGGNGTGKEKRGADVLLDGNDAEAPRTMTDVGDDGDDDEF